MPVAGSRQEDKPSAVSSQPSGKNAITRTSAGSALPAHRRRCLGTLVLAAGLLGAWGLTPVRAAAQEVPARPAPRPGTEESQPLRVKRLEFEGNRAIDDEVLRLSIATSPSLGFLSANTLGERRYLDDRELERDVIRILILYRQSGYPQAQIDTVILRTNFEAEVTFRIYEGPPIVVTAVTITGADTVVRPEEWRRIVPLRVGDPFNRFLLFASADSIRLALRNRGHPFVQVYTSFEEKRDSLAATVAFDVDPGPTARVGEVQIAGADRIDEAVIRRMVSVRPGQLFRQRSLYESQLDLYRAGLFTFASVNLVDTLPDGPDDSLVTVRVQVTEGRLGRVRFGVGYGLIDCFRALGGWTNRNFLGGGRTFDVSGRLSKIGTNVCPGLSADQDSARRALNFNVTASLREPFLFSRRLSAMLSTSIERRSEYRAFVREAIGGDVAFVYQTPRAVPITFSYQIAFGKTIADPVTLCSFFTVCNASDAVFFEQYRVQSTLAAGLVRDRSDAALDPTRGSIFTADIRYSSRFTGSDSLSQFAKGVVEFASYHALSLRTIFAWRIRAGVILPSRLGLGSQQQAFYVPPQERFYNGGPNSVRGFPQNGLGPVVRLVDPARGDSITPEGSTTRIFVPDTLTFPVGGHELVVANAELRFPLPIFSQRLRGALFVDAGQLFARGDEAPASIGLRITPGIGMRLATPLGPMRLDVAYNGYRPEASQLYVVDGTQLVLDPTAPQPERSRLLSRLQFHFSVGQPF